MGADLSPAIGEGSTYGMTGPPKTNKCQAVLRIVKMLRTCLTYKTKKGYTMKKIFTAVIPLTVVGLLFSGCGKEKEPKAEAEKVAERAIEGKKVVMIIAEKDYRDEELLDPEEVLANQGAIVSVASTKRDMVKGMGGHEVQPDLLVSQIKPEDWDAIVFVGGAGASQYWDDSLAHNLAREFFNQGKVVGAICIAPVTLANAGILIGKKATCWPSEKAKLKEKGADYAGEGVVRDGKIITASGPDVAKEFGEVLVEALKK
jgi:protease I